VFTYAYIYKGEYVECLTDKDCIDNYPENDKNYCYVGTCTSRCPPGYKQVSTGNSTTFACECDEEKGLVNNSNFGDAFANLDKCKCDRAYCFVTVYSTGIGYTDGLVPNGAPPNCKIQLDEIPHVLTQFSFYLVVGTMIIFMFIHCRSTSGVIYDFHRYYGLYVLGSTLVIVFVDTVYPFTAGFTRTMAFGIVAHNSMEWNILLRLQYGKTAYIRNSSNVCLVMYYVIMLLAMSVLQLDHLLYFAMVQGGFLDWTFFCFIFAARKTIKDRDTHELYPHECCENEYCRFVFWFGFGAIFHLLSVEILFAGFILNNAVLIGLGGFFLLPMFFFYTIWVFGQDRLMVFCGPSVFMNYVIQRISDAPPKFQIVPFKHTTRTADILWKRLVGEGYGPINKVDVEMVPSEVERGSNDKDALNELPALDALAHDITGSSRSGTFEVDDCENFKFGIDDQCCGCSCPKVPCCCNYHIPLYWVIAFICISVNAGILIQLPKWVHAEDCNEGYDYGAW